MLLVLVLEESRQSDWIVRKSLPNEKFNLKDVTGCGGLAGRKGSWRIVKIVEQWCKTYLQLSLINY